MKLSNFLKVNGFKSVKEYCSLAGVAYTTTVHRYQNNIELFEFDMKKAKEAKVNNG